MNRHKVREKALQALFQIEMSNAEPKAAIDHVLEEEEIKEDLFLNTLVFGVVEYMEDINKILVECLEKWSLKRVANVERVILQIAIFEMKYIDDIPMNVTFNEAIELTKTFSDMKSSKFVNGVLAKVKQSLEG